MKFKALLVALCCLLAAGFAGAAEKPLVVVEGVQMPGWIEHANGMRDPLAVGAALANSDRIITGPGARVLMRLADGSQIKLGENAVLALDELGRRKIKMKDVVSASLDVVKGAFRFTTSALNRLRAERDVKVRIVTITAGIRGTDLWGKADATRDVVCLIEGDITVLRGDEAFTMNEPMSFYIAPKGQKGEPVAKVSAEQLKQWAAETEIAAGKGAARKGGKWRVTLAEAATQDEALQVYDAVRKAGYAADIRTQKNEEALVYRVRVSHLASRKDAEAVAAALKGQFGITEPRVSQ